MIIKELVLKEEQMKKKRDVFPNETFLIVFCSSER